ncbi:hypothetical protein F2Q69_00027507 [Brassica cretica]|uniref:14-3-3 domain-containing protein n=1 Tax=Brassica cretica TaxID=69181 RepID=A0A8S9S915_BRACR|nr:hypothetical protein F2Q69_00027507 [Brassica cretica]
MSSGTDKERETFVYLAKLSEQAERYDEMVETMKKVAKVDSELTVEERNLLSVGYKNVIGARRASWRIMSSIEQKEESKGNESNVKTIKGYRQKVEDELANICQDILSIIDQHLIPHATSGEATVFYYKMKGDYYRYLAEFKTEQERKEASEQSLKGYEAATQAASTELPSTHPIRLGLALNFSVFYYEIMNSPERACHLAKQAFDEAIAELDTLSEESYTTNLGRSFPWRQVLLLLFLLVLLSGIHVNPLTFPRSDLAGKTTPTPTVLFSNRRDSLFIEKATPNCPEETGTIG